ncbi:MAG TPA: hypothetical protein VMU94_27830 [Streptosporangiaceae bacterium]|nr:hypothetical protein [Streptosporangiaceae bacterium]
MKSSSGRRRFSVRNSGVSLTANRRTAAANCSVILASGAVEATGQAELALDVSEQTAGVLQLRDVDVQVHPADLGGSQPDQVLAAGRRVMITRPGCPGKLPPAAARNSIFI